MIPLQYSLVIEATEAPDFFGFFSPDLDGFTGVGRSIEDCIHQAEWGMPEHMALLRENDLPVPPANPDVEIIIRNEKPMAIAA
ncbi:MAG: Predicted nuclease of the RNAse H fold, HicB family [Candidatus Kentron sp. G]|nr:MAG: Predicted nuclease of the RNAse H fold, HicB family [Candidatus Kentron sp. G]VFM99909.1 MAG: Predicted nuclease of the RNAse H fold, HicB family [Candidatus Kentron sp. G]VFN01572.1 MAG: Predicted nuclease of the RNAse H fold, HicB family [Candidatus Kentron sp. G]